MLTPSDVRAYRICGSTASSLHLFVQFGGNPAISFDHRALDGAEVGAFMQAVKRELESLQPDQPVY